MNHFRPCGARIRSKPHATHHTSQLPRQLPNRRHGSNGATGFLDARAPLANQGILLVPLRDPEFFRAFFIDAGALCLRYWLELSPSRVRAEIETTDAQDVGQCVV